MSFDWAATAQDALAALVDAGGAEPGVVLTRTTAGAYDPATSKTAAATTTTTNGVGLVFDFDLINSGAGAYEQTLIKEGDKRLYLAALTADGAAIDAPAHLDKCLAPDGLTYVVERVKVIAPAGVAVLYDVQLRR